MRKRRFRSVLLNQIVVITSCGLCIIIGMLIFGRGYLLNRKVIPDKSTKHHEFNSSSTVTMTAPKFTKMIFVLVDALRSDFINRMEFISSHCSSADTRETCCVFQCISDPPTTTMQRLKALTTGTMPTFVDVSANFNSYEIEEDSLIYQFNHAGYKIGFLGDDTWLSLFPASNFKGIVEGHPSFNAWDLDTVDYAVNATILSLFNNSETNPSWDVLIAHYLGIDHCGHRYGPNHIEMKRKIDEIDGALRFIYASMTPETLLVIVGDHGMTATGDHGGDSKDEVQAGLIFLVKDQPTVCHSNLQSPAIVSQIDLVPTLATIFRLPIPFSSLGQVIPALVDENYYFESLLENVLQVDKYIKAYGFSWQYETLDSSYKNAILAYNQLSAQDNVTTRNQFKRLSRAYLNEVKQIATSTWTHFDLTKMIMGIVVCILSLACAVLFTVQETSVDGFSQLVNFLPLLAIIMCNIVNLIFKLSDSSHIFGLIFSCLCILFLKNNIQLFQTKEPCNVNTNTNTERTDRKMHTQFQFVGAAFLIVFYGFTCLGVLSNSFVINEGSILGATLSFSLLIHCLLCKITIPTKKKRTDMAENPKKCVKQTGTSWRSCSWHIWLPFLGMLLIIRTSQTFFRCREELTTCTEEFLLHKHLSSLPNDWIVLKYIRYSVALITLAVLVVSLRSFMLGQKCILSSRPCSVIGKYIPSVLVVLLCVHWALQGLLFGQLVQIQIRPLVQYFPLVFQILAIGSILIIWWKPLCCIGIGQLGNGNSMDQDGIMNFAETIEEPFEEDETGHSNNRDLNARLQTSIKALLMKEVEEDLALDERSDFIHGSSLLTNTIIVTLLITHVTSIGYTPVMTFMLYTIAGLVFIYANTSTQDSWSAAISWTLASQFFFYATGHQPLFSSIPWDSAFTAENANSLADEASSWIQWIQPAASVLCNLYASQILFALTLPLLVFWKSIGSTNISSQHRLLQMLNICTRFIFLHGLKLLSCMVCVTIHRRHLMVWKIFTPKLIFEAIGFIVVYVTVFVSVLFILRIQTMYQDAVAKRQLKCVNPY